MIDSNPQTKAKASLLPSTFPSSEPSTSVLAPKSQPTVAINLPHSCTMFCCPVDTLDCDCHQLSLSVSSSTQTVDNRRNGISHLRDEVTSRDRLRLTSVTDSPKQLPAFAGSLSRDIHTNTSQRLLFALAQSRYQRATAETETRR